MRFPLIRSLLFRIYGFKLIKLKSDGLNRSFRCLILYSQSEAHPADTKNVEKTSIKCWFNIKPFNQSWIDVRITLPTLLQRFQRCMLAGSGRSIVNTFRSSSCRPFPSGFSNFSITAGSFLNIEFDMEFYSAGKRKIATCIMDDIINIGVTLYL